MTLPASGNKIAVSNINVEVGLSATTPNSNLDKDRFRNLAGITGSKTRISMSNFWGKSNNGIILNYDVMSEAGERGNPNYTMSSTEPAPVPGVYIVSQGYSYQLYRIYCTRFYLGSGYYSTSIQNSFSIIGGSPYSRYIIDTVSGNGITLSTADAACSFYYTSSAYYATNQPVSTWIWTQSYGGGGAIQGTLLPTPAYYTTGVGVLLQTGFSYTA
jgi:hypothetical protein